MVHMDVEVAEVVDFLAQHAPFSELTGAERRALAKELSIRYFRRGTVVIESGAPNHSLYIIRSGAVDIAEGGQDLVDRDEPGDSFGSSSLLSRSPSRYRATAVEDTLAYVLPGHRFQQLMRESDPVRDFYTPRQRGRLSQLARELQKSDDSILRLDAGDMIVRAPIAAPPSTSIREAAEIMTRERVSALLINEGDQLVGILTDRDLRSRVVLQGVPNTEPVSSVMTRNPVRVSPEMKAFELLMVMTSKKIHHLPVVRDGRALGLVSAGDLMRLESSNPVVLIGEIGRRNDPEGIAEVARQAPRLAAQLLDQGANADDVSHVLTAIADAITGRLIQLVEIDRGPAPHPWCWVTLGSQARHELGFASDQDHAMVIADEATDLSWYEEAAERVVAGLELAGLKRCPGGAMATNWHLRSREWRRQFAQWVNEPESKAVLHAQIFFDARPVHGDFTLFDELVGGVVSGAQHAQRFLGHLAAMAVRREPPLTFFRGFVLENSGAHKDQFDIKAGGLHAIIESVRVLALAAGVTEPATLTRIEALRAAGRLNDDTAAELSDAFEFISFLRLRHQAELMARNEPANNFIAPDQLSTAERRHLRYAFTAVRQIQQTIQYQWQTHLMN
ncbi:CBS domain-containing protein [Tessaracoccus oleiagri]|uniref:CBS domain-containing protein n=2 Tax=Tessaracoccus oleiagri TaxID=686624 RepID=A0A1G9JDA8_9ACTN|nr:CBS domain-containing protein [Tessaracoccus oleiagri]